MYSQQLLKGSLADFPLMAETSKLMWRLRENLIIRLYSHDIPPLLIAITTHNETTNEVNLKFGEVVPRRLLCWFGFVCFCTKQDYPTLYVAREKIVVDEKAIDTAMVEKVNILKPGLKPSDVSNLHLPLEENPTCMLILPFHTTLSKHSYQKMSS